MVERQRSGRGMARPELCVLLAYAKRLLRDEILPSTLPDDPHLHDDLAAYFPRPVVARWASTWPSMRCAGRSSPPSSPTT